MSEVQVVTLGTVEVEERETDVVADVEELREVVGIAVPYNVAVDLGNGTREMFAPGAFADAKPGATVRSYGHGAAVGRVVEVVDKPDALYYRARLSRTPAGDETWTLVRDGVLHSASVGFLPHPDGSHVAEDGTVVRSRARLLHLSMTGEPAYPAPVLAHREGDAVIPDPLATEPTHDGGLVSPDTKEHDEVMSDAVLDDLAAEVATLTTQHEDLQRSLEAIRANTAPPAIALGVQYRSAGEYMKAVVAGEEAALELLQRDFITSADVATADRPAFLADAIRLVDQGRPTWNAFSSGPLPETGNSVEFLQLSANSLTVAVQANEGDTLPYGEISFVNKTAPVKTLGGYTSLARQVVERSPVSVLDVAYTGMAISYATATNALVQAVLTAGTGFSTGTLEENTVEGWLAAVIDGVTTLATSGIRLPADAMLVSADVFKALGLLTASDGRPILNLAGPGVNQVGTLNVTGLSGNVLGLPVAADATLADGSAYVYNRNAIRTLESGGPNRLTDSDITKLINYISVYGYGAVTVPFPSSIVKLDVSAITA
jgi:uncharacterized protein